MAVQIRTALLPSCLAAALAVATLSGCKNANVRGEGFNDGTAGWTGRLRKPDDDTGLGGFSARAREIERNVGVH